MFSTIISCLKTVNLMAISISVIGCLGSVHMSGQRTVAERPEAIDRKSEVGIVKRVADRTD